MRALAPLTILLALAACNEPPGAPTVSIEPEEPTTLDGLTAVLERESVDPNKKDSVSYRWSWAVDGVVQPDLTGPQVPPDATTRGQTWAVTVTPADDKLDGPSDTASVTIRNAAPTVEIRIEPAAPLSTDDLLVVITPADPDGDTVSSRISWYRDGEDTRIQADRVPGDRTTRGEVWEVTVVPKDARIEGEPVTASVQIANQPPVVEEVQLRPQEAFEESIIEAVVQASDYDGDSLGFEAVWSVNDVPIPEITELSLDGTWFDRDDVVSVAITADDGLATSEPVASGSIVILNTPPSLGAVEVSPTEPVEGDTLTCTPTGFTDVDGDAADYRYEWRVGSTVAGTASTLDSSVFGKGDRVTCVVTPFDGLDEGRAVASRPVVVQNTPPVLSSVSIGPSKPETGTTLVATVSGISDADDDAVRLDIDWYVAGRKVSSGATLSGTSYTRGQAIYAEATPYDGSDYGTAVKSNTLTAVNAKPVITSFAVSPSTAYTDSTVSVSATATDLDRDPVSLRYAWVKNGSAYGSSSTTRLDPSELTRGDVFTVTVTPNDGVEDGAARTGTVRVVNKPPTTPTITLTPSSPESDDDLLCTITSGSTDADGDSLTTTLRWEKDGSRWTGTTSTTSRSGDTIPSSVTKSGEDWACIVEVSDGTATVKAEEEVSVSDRDGQVRTTSGTWLDVQYVQCGSGTRCTATDAEKACSDEGMKVASHASNGTSSVRSLGASSSCGYSVSYFTTETVRASGECLVGISNLRWSGCCGTSRWHGKTMDFPSKAKTVFGYVRSSDSGYVSGYPSTSGTNWACYSLATSARPASGCTKLFVACVDK